MGYTPTGGDMGGEIIPSVKKQVGVSKDWAVSASTDGFARSNNPERRDVLMDIRQQWMQEAYNESLDDFMVEMHQAECAHAIRWVQSRLLGTREWGVHARALLAQLLPEVVSAILDNTLPEKWVKNENNFRSKVRATYVPTTPGPDLDAGHYVNYLAKEDGTGLTVKEYNTFICGMDWACKTIMGVGNLARRNQDVAQKMQAFADGITAEYAQLTNGRNISELVTDSSRKNLEQFVQVNRNRVLYWAKLRNTHIMLPREVGESKNVRECCKEHQQTGEGSPKIFRLAQCVLHYLGMEWKCKFQMFAFRIFKSLKPEHASIGESLLSQMCASYASYGGFNFVQAGISVAAVEEMTVDEWYTTCDQARAEGIVDVMSANISEIEKMYKDRIAKAKVS